jgi:hypothetical protein
MNGRFNQRGAILSDKQAPLLKQFRGELLAIDGDTLYYQDREAIIHMVHYDDVGFWVLQTNKPVVTTLGWSLPTAFPLVFIHGGYVLLSWPVTIATGLVNIYAERHAFDYPMNKMTREQIRAYCRFPVGIPKDYVPKAVPW